MALAVLGLVTTGWLLDHSAELYQTARDYHYIAGYTLLAALAIRLPLLVLGKGPAHVRDLLPGSEQRRAATQTLRFYLSLGRAPLPRWYAHNPLWGPLYLILLALLLIGVLTGLVHDSGASLAGASAADLHDAVAAVVPPLILAHVLAVILHDVRGSGSDVSAMINGHRIFIVEPLQAPIDTPSTEVELRELTTDKPSRSGEDTH